jgi:dolichol-phosphate mannosyltransferase
MANESQHFEALVDVISKTLNRINSGVVYFVIDHASKDNTLELSIQLSTKDKRFITVWAPENINVVDAYIAGYKEALKNNHEFIIEMDAGLSHDPRALPMFLRVLNEGNDCAFGSRFINGGSIYESTWKRIFLSRAGTFLSNWLLGTNLYDATSGYQGFHSRIVKEFLEYGLLSKAHFYQTEIRYLLRKSKFAEIPIHYRAPSPSVSKKAIINSLMVLNYYFCKRVRGCAPMII